MKKLLTSLFVLTTVALPSVAFAEGVDAPPVQDPASLFNLLFENVQSGQWLLAFGAGLMLAVFLVRTLFGGKISWFKTKIGGYALTFGLSLAAAVGTAITSGQTMSYSLVLTALGISWAAAGGWESFKDLLAYLKAKREA